MTFKPKARLTGRSARLLLLLLFAATVAVFAANQSWWNRLFPHRRPQILSDVQPVAKRVTPPPEVERLENSFAQVAEAVKPAVVNISAIHISKIRGVPPEQFFFGDPQEFFHRFFGDRDRPKEREFRTEGTGSGVIIDPEGYILTNNHVIQGAKQLTVTLADGKLYKGKVVGTDERTDLAVILIKGSNPFPFAPLGDSENVRIGDWVLAIGSPFGLEQTVTAGIISAIRQTLTIEGRNFRGLLQTDAAINRGNSGGPLVNLRGEVVGINVAIFAPTGVFSGIGFAIPVNRAKQILSDLIEKGYVERSWMGVEIIGVDDVVARQFGLKEKRGALINSVMPDSPAEKAGFKRGDIVLQFNGTDIDNVGRLQDVVSRTEPGKIVKVIILRDGSKKTLKMKTALMPSNVALAKERGEGEEGENDSKSIQTVDWLGAEMSDLTSSLRNRFSISEKVTKGVVVVSVPVQSMAADAGLMAGDVLRSVNRTPVDSVSTLKDLKDDFDPKEGIVLDVIRRGRSFFLTYKNLQ